MIRETFAYIGNWDRTVSAPLGGVGVCKCDAETGALTLIEHAGMELAIDGTFLDPRRKVLYCTDQWRPLPRDILGCDGRVFAFSIDPETGRLTELNHKPSYGTLPCSLAVDSSGDYLVVAHHTDRGPITKVWQDASGAYRTMLEYDDATTVLFRLNSDGSIGDTCDIHKHTGNRGPLPKQTHPELHSIAVSPDGDLFVVCDRGDDLLCVFRIDRTVSKLVLCGSYSTVPGGSPRYSVFHPTRPFLYVNYETKAIVEAFRFNDKGELQSIGAVSSLPEGCEDSLKMQQSDIKVHPSGKYLYALIRGINAVTVFEIDQETGALEKIQVATLEGKGPRGCAVSPDGRFLFVASMSSKEVQVWKIGESGKVSFADIKLSQPNPGNIVILGP